MIITKVNKTTLSWLLVRAYLLFVVINFLAIIFITLLLDQEDMAWTGAGIYLILTMFISAPINLIISIILFYIKWNRELLLSKCTIIAESILYCVVMLLFSYYSKNDDMAFFVPYSVILPLLIIQGLIVKSQQSKRSHNSN